MSTDLRLSFLSVFVIPLLFLLNASACVGSHAAAQEQQKTPALTDTSEGISQTIPVREAGELSANAKSVYAFLLCDQAFRNEDEAALLEATELFIELNTPPSLWMEAGIWLLGRKSDNAVFFLKQAHSTWPDDSSLLMLYAEALKERGRTEEAVELVRTFLARNPDISDAKLELALLFVQQKHYTEAEQILSSIRRDERSPLVDLNLGKALAGMERFEEAIPYLERAHRAMPDLPDASLELGKIHERLGQLQKAVQSYENVLKTDFPAKNVLLKLISLSLQMKKPEQALRYLEDAPKDVPLQLIVADMFIDAKNYLQAANLLKPIAERNDAPVEVYLLLADLTWEHLRDLDQALAWLDKMPENYKKSSNALLLRVHLLARAEKKEEAIKEAAKDKAIFRDEPKFWEAEARILTSMGRHAEAIAVMREAVSKWPDDMNMLFLMGNILDESGDKKTALSLMEKIIQRDPDNFQALNYVGYTLAEEARDIERAVKLLERATSLAPDRAYIIDSLAWAYFRAGRQNDALREIRRAVKLATRIDPAIWEHYGDIAQKSGLTEEARDAYTRALELNPDNAEELKIKREKQLQK